MIERVTDAVEEREEVQTLLQKQHNHKINSDVIKVFWIHAMQEANKKYGRAYLMTQIGGLDGFWTNYKVKTAYTYQTASQLCWKLRGVENMPE